MGKGLSAEQIIRCVREAAEPVIASFGLRLWGIEVLAGGRTVVRVYVDAQVMHANDGSDDNGECGVLEGVSVDQCAEISRMVGLALEVEDVFSGAWVLEVSSPGLDRVFFDPDQLVPYIGRDIDVTLTDSHPDIPGRRKFKGPLKSVSGAQFVMEALLALSSGEKPAPAYVTINWGSVKKARLIPVFPESSRPVAGKKQKKRLAKAEVKKHEPGIEESH